MKKLFRYLFGSPSKSFPVELQFMFWLRDRNLKNLARWQKNRLYYKHSVWIHLQANIHNSVVFPHPVGMVIGAVNIKEGCVIHQNVTLGESRKKGLPTIDANTHIFSGAVIGGGIYVGENCVIGANSVITKDIPDNSVVVGANKIIRTNSMDSKESK
ncbi:serine acetyltransferase [Vibrio parahaemolyticus]|uniref:serine O-acetyltransferase n=1 Tax=Vibrio parahaemolyticus TaxID=670 RepID=UPI000C87914A|nr:serine acetyltransferase [Vibrio parahaemolyticus]PMT73872.1 serine acetyltransferase [Vibrio parahaemolyticus]PMT79072.1 serine acetyltransferase [Vibrio parahaemolyticus]